MKKLAIILSVIACILSVTLFCGCDPEQPASDHVTLTVQASHTLRGKASNIRVAIDGRFLATLQPGGYASKEVDVGNHRVSAASAGETYEWSYTVNVGADGHTTTLTP